MVAHGMFGPRFEVLAVIGKGSYGTVYKALDLEDTAEGVPRPVAIKHIQGLFTGGTRKAALDEKRVLREVKLLRLLSKSEDMVQLKSIILPSQRNFKDLALVFELFEADLDQVIKLNPDLQPEHHQWFLFQMLRCLSYMHQANILHRDLKPRNIIVNSDCKVKICDLGLARPASNEVSNEMWTDYVATRWYRAPELCGSFSATYTPEVDVWSIGCIFAELLLRRPIFTGKDVVHQLEVITDILGTPPAYTIAKVRNPKARAFLASMPRKAGYDLFHVFKKTDPKAVHLLSRMLQFDPDERISAAEALRHPFFANLQDLAKQDHPKMTGHEFDYEQANMQLEDIRELLWLEVLEYHPQVQKKEKARSVACHCMANVSNTSDLLSVFEASRAASASPPKLTEDVSSQGSFVAYLSRGLTLTSDPGLTLHTDQDDKFSTTGAKNGHPSQHHVFSE